MPVTKTTRFDIRLPQSEKETIAEAAAVLGQSQTTFARQVLLSHARQTLDETNRIRLSGEDFDAFVRLLDKDVEPTAAAKRAARRFRRLKERASRARGR